MTQPDQHLEQLLHTTLGRGSLPAERKRLHREQLGLIASPLPSTLPANSRFLETGSTDNDFRTITSTTGGAFRERLELITIVTVIALVIGGVLFSRMFLAGDGPDEPGVGDVELSGGYDVYVRTGGVASVTGVVEPGTYTPIDRETLQDRTDLSELTGVRLIPSNGIPVYVRIEYPEAMPNPLDGDPSDGVRIVILDSQTGEERNSFHAPAFVQTPYLSQDGSKLAVQTASSTPADDLPNWWIINTNDGRVISTIDDGRTERPEKLFFSTDNSIMYRVMLTRLENTNQMTLQVIANDVETGAEIAYRDFDSIQSSGGPTLGIAISTDRQLLAVAHADVKVVSLIDLGRLTIEQSFAFSGSDSEPEPWTEDSNPIWSILSAELSLDGRFLYISGSSSAGNLGFTAVDLENRRLAGEMFEGSNIVYIIPSPDGESLYISRLDETSKGPVTIYRLNPETLEILAEREVPVYAGVMINPIILPKAPVEPEAVEERLYVVTDNEVVAVDPLTGEEFYSIDSSNPYAALSPDGTRLYVVGTGDPFTLSALEASTGVELWRTDVSYRPSFTVSTLAPSILSVSPNGEQIYVHSYDVHGDFPESHGDAPKGDASNIPYWVQAIDATTGQHLFDTEKIPGYCFAEVRASPDSGLIHEICTNIGLIRISDGQTGQLLDEPRSEIGIVGVHQSPDSSNIYLISGSRVRILNAETGEIADPPALIGTDWLTYPHGLTALSPDGNLLYIGLDPENASDWTPVRKILVFDTSTWEEVRRIEVDVPLDPGSAGLLSVSHDGQHLYASEQILSSSDSKVVRINISTGETDTALQRINEVQQVILGPTPDSASSPSTNPSPETTIQDPLEFLFEYRQTIDEGDLERARDMWIEPFRAFSDDVLFAGAYSPHYSFDANDWTVEENDLFTVVRPNVRPDYAYVLRKTSDGWLIYGGLEGLWHMQRQENDDYDRYPTGYRIRVDQMSDQNPGNTGMHIGISVNRIVVDSDNTMDVSVEWRVTNAAVAGFPLDGLSWAAGDRQGDVEVTWGTIRLTDDSIEFPIPANSPPGTYIYSATLTLHDIPDSGELRMHMPAITLTNAAGDERVVSAILHLPVEEYPAEVE